MLRKIVPFIPLAAFLAVPGMAAAKDDALQMVSIDVEGGGGTLFVTPEGKSLLIDTGNPEVSRATGAHPSSERIAAAASALGVKKIDYLLTTHYHGDHIGGFEGLLARMPIGIVIDHGENRETTASPNPTAPQIDMNNPPPGSTAYGYRRYVELIGSRRHIIAKPGDVFHIGSCTKSMTATLTAILIDEGKLRWDTTIAEVFPELKGKMDKQYETVTVEQLLHHRGGVPGAPPAAAWKRAWEEQGTPTQQRREFIEAVLSQPPEAAPGTKMIYSNQGYAIVGAMLEKITGQDYEALITEKLFKPLHMDSAGFGPPGITDKVDQPWGHIHKLFMTIPVQSDNPPAIASAGRVHCSLDDLARFTIFHLQYHATNGLLKPETLAKLHAPPAGANNISPMENYACGWVVLQRGWAGGTALWHHGSNTMWYIVMWLAPEKDFAVIAATNIAGPDAEQGCDDACVAMIHKWLPD